MKARRIARGLDQIGLLIAQHGRERIEHLHDAIQQRFKPLRRRGGYREHLYVRIGSPKAREVFLRLRQVGLVGCDELRNLREQRGKLLELGVDFLKIFNRVAQFAACDVEHMHKHARALDMPEEIVPKPRALRRTFDEAGNIREHKRAVVAGSHAEVGGQRGEMIGRDLRFCGGQHGEDGGFANGGEADEADVRNGLELQLQLILCGLDARLRKTGRLLGCGCELRVAFAAASAVQNDPFLACLAHVGEDGAALQIAHDRADGNADDQRLAVLAAAEFGFARFAILRAIEALKFEIQQRGEMRIGKKHNVSAASAVSAVRPALHDVFFTMEGCVPVSAVSGFDDDSRFIDKLHDLP
ncbi:hypothetical protein SDC9_123234 [bioreactor metagenome]|uniref:Uncharacterized protein n=1 Tax=bioreactor metagenome TaxID=1076179 RepID=A0A645CH10_9ZZZZ